MVGLPNNVAGADSGCKPGWSVAGLSRLAAALALVQLIGSVSTMSAAAPEPGAGKAPILLAAAKKATPKAEAAKAEAGPTDAKYEHTRLFSESKYPSAATCRTCHPDHYREWSVSAHAYGQLSPVFNAMAATTTKLTSGANGDFCIRCHTQVGMNLGEPVFMSNMDRHPTSREGITCIVCHRLERVYGKVSGRFALVAADITKPAFGPTGDAELKRVLSKPDEYPSLVTNPNETGLKIHGDIEKSEQLRTPGFCGSCHDVTLMNGFRLEEAFSSFKNSPAAHRGETCQDCHMGQVPGKKSGYAEAPAAIIGGDPNKPRTAGYFDKVGFHPEQVSNGTPTKPRRRTNHMFAGPDYSILHAGLFPHNDKAAELATMREWITFNYKEGWGTDEFEKNIPKDYKFPPRWSSADDRYDARAILAEQFKTLDSIHQQRLAVMRQGYQLGDLVVKKADPKSLKFAIEVKSGTDGHNVPTGFDAERIVYMQVFVTDPQGKEVFKSGDLDPNGDVRDLHSTYVHRGDLPLDPYLFKLQSPFITRNVRGGDRQQILPINYSIDPLPYIRPEPFAVTFTGRPGGARIQRRGIEALASRWADYQVSASELTGPGPYKVHIKIRAGMVPINLVNEVKITGFDYNMSPRQVADAVRDGQVQLYDKEVSIELNGQKPTINLAELPNLTEPHALIQFGLDASGRGLRQAAEPH